MFISEPESFPSGLFETTGSSIKNKVKAQTCLWKKPRYGASSLIKCWFTGRFSGRTTGRSLQILRTNSRWAQTQTSVLRQIKFESESLRTLQRRDWCSDAAVDPLLWIRLLGISIPIKQLLINVKGSERNQSFHSLSLCTTLTKKFIAVAIRLFFYLFDLTRLFFSFLRCWTERRRTERKKNMRAPRMQHQSPG